jgi:AbiJ N-terminal domain 4
MIAQANQPEVYQYDKLPVEFRRQVIHIWRSSISAHSSYLQNDWWRLMHEYIIRELGVFKLGQDERASPESQCFSFLLNAETPIDNIIDLLEITFHCVDKHIRKDIQECQIHPAYLDPAIYRQLPDDAINELNHRFREHSIGYQYNNGHIIRVDSGFIHAEVVVPALTLLSSQDFSGAEQEFRVAHKYYREQEYKETIANALKAFESTMKTICNRLGWDYEENDTASKLIEKIVKKELIPKYHQESLHALKRLLESVSTPRNKEAGHGQGEDVKNVPAYLAGYALHITASNIIFLVEACKDKQNS